MNSSRPLFWSRTLLVFVAIIWGLSYVVISIAVASISPMLFNALRFAIALLSLLCIYPIVRKINRSGTKLANQPWREGISLGAILFVAFATQTFGYATTTATNAGFISGLGFVLVPMLNFLLTGRKIALWAVSGILVSVLGLFFLTGAGEHGISRIVVGDYLMFIQAVLFALHIVLTAKYAHERDVLVLTIWQIGVMALLFFFSTMIFENPYVWTQAYSISMTVFLVIIFTALASTCFGYVAQTYVQKTLSPVDVAMILALEPVFTGTFDYFLSGTRLSPVQITGCVLIMIGIILVEYDGRSSPSTQSKA